MSALAIVFWRVALGAAAIALALVVLRRRSGLRLPGKAPLGLGVLLAIHWGFYFSAIQETSVASAVLITYTAPVFMALLAPRILRERLTRRQGVSLLVSLGGVMAIGLSAGGGQVRTTGVVLALFAAASFALLIVLYKRYAAHLDPVSVVMWESLVAAMVLSPAAASADYSLSLGEVAALLSLGVVLTGGVTVLYVASLRRTPVGTAGVLNYLEPVSAALLAALLIGEELNGAIVVGGLAIVAAGVAVALEQRLEDPVPPLTT